MIVVGMSAEVALFGIQRGVRSCPDFGEIYITLRDEPTWEMDGFLLRDRYLFRFCKLCILSTPLRDFLFWKLHAGGLAGQNKTIEAIEHKFYWPSLKRDSVALVNWPSNRNKLPVLTLSSQYPIAFGKM